MQEQLIGKDSSATGGSIRLHPVLGNPKACPDLPFHRSSCVRISACSSACRAVTELPQRNWGVLHCEKRSTSNKTVFFKPWFILNLRESGF